MTNLFKVNHFYKEKDAILRALFDSWQKGEDNTRYGSTTTDLGRALSVLKIHHLTSLSKEHIDTICISLSNSGHITKFRDDKNEKNHLWLITESGRQVISDNYYLNQRGLDNRVLFFQIGGFVISAIALLISIYASYTTTTKAQSLKQEVDNKINIQQNLIDTANLQIHEIKKKLFYKHGDEISVDELFDILEK